MDYFGVKPRVSHTNTYNTIQDDFGFAFVFDRRQVSAENKLTTS